MGRPALQIAAPAARMARMHDLDIRYTNDYETACRLRDAGYEPVECAFGQHGSVMGRFDLDHHGAESHREGVALRACRDHYGALADDPRFVVTGTPDADAVLAIVALAGRVPAARIPADFYALVDEHDTDPIGKDLLATEQGLRLAWFNQRPGLYQNADGFQKAIGHMETLLRGEVSRAALDKVHRADMARRNKAVEGVSAIYDGRAVELDMPDGAMTRPVLRGDLAVESRPRVAVVHCAVWGFDVWYRLAPVVVSYASRMAKVTVGCPDTDTAERLFGPGGLARVWPALGKGWGGRETIGGSPRGQRLKAGDAGRTALELLDLLIV